MKRRDFVKGAAAAGAGLALGGSRLTAGETRPNVLVIEVDQMRTPRWTMPGITPHIDRLAASGVSFDHHYTSAVPCSPSRACLFTGLYTTQNKMFSNCDFVEGRLQPSLDPKIPTLGHIFRDAGYRTPYRGKWHLTRKSDRHKKDALIDYGFEGWKPPEAPFGGPPYNGALMDPVYAGEAVDWLRDPKNHREPWLLVSSLVNPHDICAYPRYYPHEKLKPIRTPAPPDNWTDDLSGKPRVQLEYQQYYRKVGGPIDVTNPDAWRRYLDYYAHCIKDVDENVGRVLAALDQSGQRQNTIIVFTSDHGEMGGSHRLRTKGNFAYEEVMNVPLIFAWDGHLPAGRTASSLASNVDVIPTLTALAGLSNLPYLAGKDLSPVLGQPESAAVRDEVLYHTDWEIVFTVNKKATDVAMYRNPSHIRALRDREWKYAFYFSPNHNEVEHELYNLKDDPLEMKNLGADPGYQAQRQQMHDRLMAEEKRLLDEYKG
jgi:arylsulfatase A-like enzyme